MLCFSGLLPLDQSLLVVLTLQSHFFDSQKFVDVVFVPCCDLHRLTYLMLLILFYDVESNTNMPESLQDY